MMKRDISEAHSSESIKTLVTVQSEPARKKKKQERTPEVKVPHNGIILMSGRLRFADKLMSYLNASILPGVLYWQEDGKSFSVDTKKAQKELLDRHFKGMKLSSFIRSLNRWSFKRTFHALDPQSVLSYEHPLFRQNAPELVAHMTMVSHPAPASVVQASAVDENQAKAETREDTEEKIPAKPRSHPDAAFMISELQRMKPQLQSIFEVQNRRHQERELAGRQARQQLAIQAILATRQSTGFSRDLQLPRLDLQGLIQSSLVCSPDKRANNSSTLPSMDFASRKSPLQLAEQLLNLFSNCQH